MDKESKQGVTILWYMISVPYGGPLYKYPNSSHMDIRTSLYLIHAIYFSLQWNADGDGCPFK